MRRVAIIQARMSSSRLPGKSLTPLVGKPVIWHVFHRLAKCRSVDEVVLATSTDPTDDPLAEYATEQGVRVVRGPLDNVLQRYVMAAEQTGADVIVRVTGDAVLVDPDLVDVMLDKIIESGADYCGMDPGIESIHEGFECFTRDALHRVVGLGPDPASREHVTPTMKQREDVFRVTRIPVPRTDAIAGVRASIDTPADIAFMTALYEETQAAAGELSAADAVRVLRNAPDILKLNEHVRQRGAFDAPGSALIRCDGDSRIGLGHVVRCIALGRELAETRGLGVRVALAADAEGAELVRRAGLGVEVRPDGVGEEQWLDELVERTRPDAMVLDIRTPLEGSALRRWSEGGALVVVLDDISERRLAADLVFYPPVPQVEALSWDGARGIVYRGWEWVVLRPDFAGCKPASRPCVEEVLLSAGGADPSGLTSQALDAVLAERSDFRLTVVTGAAFEGLDALRRKTDACGDRVRLLHDVTGMQGLMCEMDAAVCAFGVVAYELAACGVPAIHLCRSDDDAESSSAFVSQGIAGNVRVDEGDWPAHLGSAFAKLADDSQHRLAMSRAAAGLVDGRGAARIAAMIEERIAK